MVVGSDFAMPAPVAFFRGIYRDPHGGIWAFQGVGQQDESPWDIVV